MSGIDPDDLAFMARTGVDVEELARRVGVKPASLIRQAQRHGIRMPESWKRVELDDVRERRAASRRRTRIGAGLPKGAVKRPEDCCPYCPTTRAALPAEQLSWAMRPKHARTCGRETCRHAHDIARQRERYRTRGTRRINA